MEKLFTHFRVCVELVPGRPLIDGEMIIFVGFTSYVIRTRVYVVYSMLKGSGLRYASVLVASVGKYIVYHLEH